MTKNKWPGNPIPSRGHFRRAVGTSIIILQGPVTPAPPCIDKLANCDSYDQSVCTNPDYKAWAADNCRKFCRHELCTGALLHYYTI